MSQHPLFNRANELTSVVIGAAIEVHRNLGPGLLESIYEKCLMHELELQGVRSAVQRAVKIQYKDFCFDETLRFDLLVEDCLLVEIKAIENVLPVHQAQVISYLKLLNVPLGLLFNFHELKLSDGIKRLILPSLR